MDKPTEDELTFVYKNHNGITATRRVLPIEIWHGKTEWHPDLQWFLKACDLDKTGDSLINVYRDFALSDIVSIEAAKTISAAQEKIERLENPWQPIETAPKDKPILGWAVGEEEGWECMVIEWTEAQHDPNFEAGSHDAGWSGRILYPGGTVDDEYCPATFEFSHWRYQDEPIFESPPSQSGEQS